jgi:hypothetical protein
MGTTQIDLTGDWAPPSCTLPAAERPLRLAQFDRLFTDAVRAADRVAPTRLRLDLEPTPEVAAQAAGLMARETACCSFFAFALVAASGGLRLDVYVPVDYVEALDALATRAAEVRA